MYTVIVDIVCDEKEELLTNRVEKLESGTSQYSVARLAYGAHRCARIWNGILGYKSSFLHKSGRNGTGLCPRSLANSPRQV